MTAVDLVEVPAQASFVTVAAGDAVRTLIVGPLPAGLTTSKPGTGSYTLKQSSRRRDCPQDGPLPSLGLRPRSARSRPS
jgi:hypothetical protein